ncbi:MAG TPA: hypothetical protein VJO16_06890 [Candidatus Acidoferrum sp.]|nr:hypothetical protein [Candidatus Acidoferrum sp.]
MGSRHLLEAAVLSCSHDEVRFAWVSIHNGGGVGIGYSQHSGQVTVADGTKEMAKRIERVLTNDPGTGVVRHVDAGYPEAIAFAKKNDVKVPML